MTIYLSQRREWWRKWEKLNAIKKQLKSVIYTQINSIHSISHNFPIRLCRLSRQLLGLYKFYDFLTKSPGNVNYISMSNLIFFEFTTRSHTHQWNCVYCVINFILYCALNEDWARRRKKRYGKMSPSLMLQMHSAHSHSDRFPLTFSRCQRQCHTF